MTCRHGEWLTHPPSTPDEWANFDAEAREHRAGEAPSGDPRRAVGRGERRLAYIESLLRPLRELENLRSGPMHADWYCPECLCLKSQDRREQNPHCENCEDGECPCHLLWVLCDFCDHVGPDTSGRWLVESGPPGTQTIWACERCANDQENADADDFAGYPS